MNIFFFKKKKLFSYDKLFLKVDVISFILWRSHLEYFRAFKYNEYLFNNYRVNNYNLKYALSVPSPDFLWIVHYLPVQRKFFFRFFNFYKLFFYTFTKPRAVNRAFTRYILYKPNFFILFEFFSTIHKFYDFFVSTFISYLGTYILVICSLMFCYVDRLIDESCPVFPNLCAPYIYMKELNYLIEPGFMEQSFLEYFVPRLYLDLLSNRAVFNAGVFFQLDRTSSQKLHIDRLSYNI